MKELVLKEKQDIIALQGIAQCIVERNLSLEQIRDLIDLYKKEGQQTKGMMLGFLALRKNGT